ncbi:MAG: SpoVA/SpoVAEb family sporulation membrane protein [Clostridia bacterium]|nr:SpoVA/SpoVAEb family sporulation membrane protein [Clostridia bacterium]
MEYLRAFTVGGALCVLAQILIDKTRMSPGRILVIYVVAGVALGAVGLYGPLVEFAGGGATVPLTGFGWLISEGVRKAVDAEGAVGILKGGVSAAAGGITAALFFGAVASLVFRSKPKR